MPAAKGRELIQLYLDEDVTDRLASLLRERGYDATSALGMGKAGLTDHEQLVFATRLGRAILTSNHRDVVALARCWYDEGREHAGIVLSRQFSVREIGELLRQVCNLLEAVSAREMWNTVRNLQSYR
jgi:predicted nuclease of predicted toxin-antitoxin system